MTNIYVFVMISMRNVYQIVFNLILILNIIVLIVVFVKMMVNVFKMMNLVQRDRYVFVNHVIMVDDVNIEQVDLDYQLKGF